MPWAYVRQQIILFLIRRDDARLERLKRLWVDDRRRLDAHFEFHMDLVRRHRISLDKALSANAQDRLRRKIAGT